MNLSSRVFKYLLLGTSALTLPTGLMAQELPTGGQVAAGGASISHTSPHALTINQSTNNAVINWQGFSVGQGNRVDIIQPDASSALLNRVTGNAPSTIAGAINANGQVYLVNPNGITISSTGQVSAAGFAASTLNIGDDDFMAGRRTFTGNGASGHVANHGTIRTVGRGGYAALIGGTVENTGLIAAPMGKIALGSGEQATLDFAGDGFLQVAIPTKAKGKDALVKQSGKLSANGGMVVMSAAAAKEAARQAVNMSGIVEARGVSSRGGVIRLTGGNGKVVVSGKMNASGKKGGNITVTGNQIALQGAQMDASGVNGGGKVRIGGDREGKGSLPGAQGVTIDAATVIAADALTYGNGGDVVVWSDGTTRFSGTISAKGGALSGNGGEVEVSGKAVLDYTGQTILTAANGRFGTLLLDPYNVTISTGADSGTPGSTPNSVINVTTLQNQLALGNVIIATGSVGDGGGESGNITVANGLAWSSGTTLTLNAVNAIAINAPISIGGGSGLALNYDAASLHNLAFGTHGKITYTAAGGSLAINNDAYGLLYSIADIQAIGLSGRYALAHDIDVSGTLYTSALVSNFDGILNGLGNSISNLSIHTNDQTSTGLFSYVHNQGIIRDLHLKGGAFQNTYSPLNSALYAGSFVGYNYGTLSNVSSTASVKIVSGTALDVFVGGLVGYSTGRIERSSAGGAVTATAPAMNFFYPSVGGLVGANLGQITGSYATGIVRTPDLYSYARIGGLVGVNTGIIAQSYALGGVISNPISDSSVGGFVGYNTGNITQSYAAGAVLTSGNYVGGFIGENSSLYTFQDNYWNTETTGRAQAVGFNHYGHDTTTGLTTAQLQGALPSGFDASVWGTGAGLYPYLNSFFTNGVKAISGIARRDGLALASTSGNVHSLGFAAEGKLLGSAATGVNGYYYIAVDAEALPANTSYLAYSTTANAALYQPTATGNIGDIDFKSNTLVVDTEHDRLSAVYDDVDALLATDAAARSMIDGLSGLDVESQASRFIVDRSVTIKGAHGFALNVADYALGDDATVTFVADDGTPLTTSAGGSLTINGQNYALLYSMTDIQGINAAGLAGRYAMARDIDAAGTTYTQAIVGSEASVFNGTFTGLGHTLSNLTLDTTNLRYVGMFAVTGTASIIRDIHLGNGSVAASHSSSYIHAGGLVGENRGRILSASFGGSVSVVQTGGNYYDSAYAGGLVGYNQTGQIENSRAAGEVSASGNIYDAVAGGLAGYSYNGTITGSRAAVDVSASIDQASYYYYSNSIYAGGLVGHNVSSAISHSSASGAVSTENALSYVYNSYAGGLVGYNSGGAITNTFASGAVHAAGAYYSHAGGLVGYNNASLSQSYAAGAVSASTLNSSFTYVGGLVGVHYGQITGSYATGTVRAPDHYSYARIGGLVGDNYGSITQSYASGAVVSNSLYENLAGGFIGRNNSTTFISQNYAMGALVISGSAYYVGGFIGQEYYHSSNISNNYWNVQTAGYSNGFGYSYYTQAGVTGLTTAQLQGVLPAGFDSAIWGTGTGLNPYLKSFFPDGLAAISGVVRLDGSALGSTAANGLQTLSLVLDGAQPVAVTLGADGSYYFTLDANQPTANAGFMAHSSAANAVSYRHVSNAGANDFDFTSDALHVKAAQGQWSAVEADVQAFLNNNTSMQPVVSALSGLSLVYDGSFTVDTAIARTGHIALHAADDLSLGASGTVSSSNGNVVLSAADNFINGRGSDAVSANGRWLIYSQNASDAVFGDLNSGNTAVWNTAVGANVSATGNRYVFAARPTLTVNAVNATKTYGDTINLGSYYTVTGFSEGVDDAFLGDTAGGVLSGSFALTSTGSGATANAGNYTIALGLGTATSSGYQIVLGSNSTLTVTQRALSVAANSASRVYGDANPALTYITNGLVNGDSLSGALATNATVLSHVGNYNITQGTLGNANYIISFTGAQLGVTPRALSVVANSASRVYGEANPALTYVATGLVNGDSLSGALVTDATVLSNVGSYGITQGTLDAGSNYTMSFTGNQLGVTQRALSVAANSASRVYGNTNPALIYAATGLVNGDSLSGGLATNATVLSNVGNYGITQGTLDAGNNYAITFTGNQLSITQRHLTVNAHAQTRFYGFNNSPLTYTANGLVNGDNLTGELFTPADATSPIGQYSITQGSLAASSNYDLSFNGAELTVAPIQAQITASVVTNNTFSSDGFSPDTNIYNSAAQSFSPAGFSSGEIFTDPRLEAPVVCLSAGQCTQVTVQ